VADGQFKTGPGVLVALIIAGTENCTAAVYDGTDALGDHITTIAALANDSRSTGKVDRAFSTGLFLNLTGACAVTAVLG
jgi:hypothetical protein